VHHLTVDRIEHAAHSALTPGAVCFATAASDDEDFLADEVIEVVHMVDVAMGYSHLLPSRAGGIKI